MLCWVLFINTLYNKYNQKIIFPFEQRQSFLGQVVVRVDSIQYFLY